VDFAGGAAASLKLAAVLEKEDVTAVAALPGVEAEAVIDEALQQSRALDASGSPAFATGTLGRDNWL
jgi:hypothetical protein